MTAISASAGRWAGRAAISLAAVPFALLAIGPHTGWYRTLTVLTASMRPTFPPGSVIVVVPVPVARVGVGDVITYPIPVEDHRVVTHRVVEVMAPGVVRTKGDANNADDPWVARLEGTTAWQVRGGVPGVGQVIQTMRQPGVRLVGVLASALLVTLMGMRRIWRRHSDA